MNAILKNKTHLILFIFNLILFFTGWIMSTHAYLRLPEKILLWLPFSGQPEIFFKKSLLFFITPSVQTVFFFLFLSLSCLSVNKKKRPDSRQGTFFEIPKETLVLDIEQALLVLIFFNLIFIHIQRSLILMAHEIERGISPIYFYSLFGIILILIPYFRFRKKMISTNPPETDQRP